MPEVFSRSVQLGELQKQLAAIGRELQGLEEAGSELATLATETVQLDPRRFKFKLAGHEGTTTALRDATCFDPDLCGVLSVWRDPADGLVFMVDGHHRPGLAVRLSDHPHRPAAGLGERVAGVQTAGLVPCEYH